MRPTIRQLEYLVALAHHRHFGRAAEACAVTQPGLSAQIKTLESTLGVQLFERHPDGALPTPAGEEAVGAARRILDATDAMVARAGTDDTPLSRVVRLGVIPTIAPYLLPPALTALRREYPGARVYLREQKTAELVELLGEGRLDVVVAALPLVPERFDETELFHDPFVLVVPRSHRLAKRKRARTEDLADEEVLLLEDGHCLRDQALSVCELAGAREHGGFRASSLGTLIQMVAGGIGVTLLPKVAAAVEVRGPKSGIVAIPFGKPEPARTVGVAWRRGAARAAEYELIAEILRERAPA